MAARSARFASRRLKTVGGSTVPGVVAREVDPKVLTKLSRRFVSGRQRSQVQRQDYNDRDRTQVLQAAGSVP